LSDPFADHQDNQELVFVLQHVGYGLFGLFLAFLLKLVWPVALLQPAWQLQFANGLRTTGLFPLLGAVLLLLAGRLHGPSGGALAGQLLWVRRAGFLAALGFLLLIPLQIRDGLVLLGAGNTSELGTLGQVKIVAQEIRAARSEAAMKLALTHLPGAPPEIKEHFTKPLDQVRTVVLSQLQPQIERVDRRLAELHRQRLRAALLGWICDGLAALALAVCFGAFGSFRAGGPSLLLLALAVPALLLEAVQGLGKERRQSASAEAQWIEALHGESSGEAAAEGAGEGDHRP
jgi:hypothetical protein